MPLFSWINKKINYIATIISDVFFHAFYAVYGWLFPKAEPVKQYRLGKAWLYALGQVNGRSIPNNIEYQYEQALRGIADGANAPIDVISMKVIVRGLVANPVTKIHFSTSAITDAAMLIFAKFLELNKDVEEVSIECHSRYQDRLLRTVRISEQAMQTLVASLNQNTKIKKLYLRFIELKEVTWPCVINLLRNNSVIQEVGLTGNVITTNIAEELMAALKARNLRTLDLSECAIDTAAINIIADNLANGTNIEKIVIRKVDIDDEGLGFIATALTSKNIRVKNLDISRIQVSTAGLKIILSALEKNKTLQTIALPESEYGTSLTRYDARQLAKHPTLKKIILDSGNTSDLDVSEMVLHEQCRIEHLEMIRPIYDIDFFVNIAKKPENLCLVTLKYNGFRVTKDEDEQTHKAIELVNEHRKNMLYCYGILKCQIAKALPTEVIEKIASYAKIDSNFRQPFKFLRG